MNGPSVHYTDVSIPLAEDSEKVRMMASAFKMLGSSAFRVAMDRHNPTWPFPMTFNGAMDSNKQVYDVTITVIIAERKETPDDTTG